MPINPNDELLLPSEVSALFGVEVKTVTRWVSEGRLTCIRTLGGHRRYRKYEVMSLLRENDTRENEAEN